MSETLCLIPARGGSKRFPHKNRALLLGQPLISYAIGAAASAGVFDEVWVSTDDAAIADIARGARVQVHDRPAALAADDARIIDVVLDFLSWREAQGRLPQKLCTLLPTAALVRPEDLRGASALLAARNADFVMAVTTYLDNPFLALEEHDGFLRLFFGTKYLKRSQLLPEVTVDSGYFYLASVSALRKEQTFYGQRLVGYPIPRERSVDIDEPAHLKIAEALHRVAAGA